MVSPSRPIKLKFIFSPFFQGRRGRKAKENIRKHTITTPRQILIQNLKRLKHKASRDTNLIATLLTSAIRWNGDFNWEGSAEAAAGVVDCDVGCDGVGDGSGGGCERGGSCEGQEG